MWPRKKPTPQMVVGTDKEWSQTGTLVHKPPRGWLHADSAIIEGGGVCYCVQYVGLMQITKSMRSLKFDDRTSVTREAMMRCVEESGIRATKKRKVHKNIGKMLGGRPNITRAGTSINLKISIDGLRLTAVESGEIIADHGMPSISFATGGEGEGIDFIGYVAKDSINDRACHCFDCGDLAYDIITTIGQAFELRYKTYLNTKAVPLEIHSFGESRNGGMGFFEDSPATLQQSNVPPPPRRGALPDPPSSAAAAAAATAAEKLDAGSPSYDTLNAGNKRHVKANHYDVDGPAGGSNSHEHVSLRKPCEELGGYAKVREEGAAAGGSSASNRNSSYDNPNVFYEQEERSIMYDNPEGREGAGSRANNTAEQNGHAGASKRPSHNPSFDDKIYDNSGSDAHPSLANGQRGGMVAAQSQNRSSGGNASFLHSTSAALLPPAGHNSSHPNRSSSASHQPSMPLPPVPSSSSAVAAVHPGSGGGSSSGVRSNGQPSALPSIMSSIDVNHDLMAHDWFHGILSREEAENILEEDGEFLVRESSTQPGQYVLSGMEGGRVKHLLLVDPEGVVRTRDRIFASVPELIHYHIEHSLPIVSAGSSLTLGTAVVIDMSQE